MEFLLRKGYNNLTNHRICYWYELHDNNFKVTLTPAEGLIVLYLMYHAYAFNSDLSEVLWPDPDYMPDWSLSVIKAHVCRVNKKLLFFGYKVVNYSCRGYVLENLNDFQWEEAA